MIGYLRGQLLSVDSQSALLLAGGVGYEVDCTPATLTALVPDQTADLFIYTQVREDAIQLYGFQSMAEKQLFMSLIKVNGIGPRSALQILAAGGVQQVVDLINRGDAKGLSALPKVGKKTAEQIILTLKGKLIQVEEVGRPQALGSRQAVISALVHLGFRLSDVERAVERMAPDVDLETGVREGLAALTS
ncbi:MAG: Holliday junction branch migration protein RuvA [Bdellovibrionales bacterium]